MKNRLIALLLSMLILIAGSGIGAAADLIVHNGGSIQAAVDNATSGDSIIVEPGTYYENVTLNKYDLVIMSQSGNPEDTIIQGDGFYLQNDAQGITIKGFTLKGTDTSYGISIGEFANCIIENNKIQNCGTGVDVNLYSNFTINNNEISNCESGIFIGECYSNPVVRNNRVSNCGTGIVVGDLGYPQIEKNTITENDQGISLMYEGRADIAGNIISFNKKCGLYDKADGVSKIHNNYFNNTVNVIFDDSHDSPNIWNTTKTKGTNIINGSYIAGNYWAKPDGTDFSQIHYDVNGDGIAEEAFTLNGNEIDYAALATPKNVIPVQPAIPAENSTENSTENLTENSTETPSETLTETPAEALTEEIADTGSSSSDGSSGGSSHSSSGSSSGGSGGGGGSPEPAKNVEVKELSQKFITNGKPVKFDFSKNATSVVYVGFDAKKTTGKTTAIAEQLKGKSTLVSELGSGEVYKYFNLWVGNSGFATSKNIENPVVCFKIEKSWLQDKKIDQASITLNRYSDKKWSQLPVKLSTEDNKYLYFTAETPGFSFFAITGKAAEKENVAETKPSTDTSELEQNSTASETEPEHKSEQETEKDKGSRIPGFGTLYSIICLLIVFFNKKK